jgi:hypothetical protein
MHPRRQKTKKHRPTSDLTAIADLVRDEQVPRGLKRHAPAKNHRFFWGQPAPSIRYSPLLVKKLPACSTLQLPIDLTNDIMQHDMTRSLLGAKTTKDRENANLAVLRAVILR